MTACIVGWSHGKFGKLDGETSESLVVKAATEAIAELDSLLGGILGDKSISADELSRVTANSINELPGRFETSSAVLGAMMTNDLLGRPDNYYETLADRYRGLTAPAANAALRGALARNGFVWVVVGDAATVKPQLAKLGMPVEVVEAR